VNHPSSDDDANAFVLASHRQLRSLETQLQDHQFSATRRYWQASEMFWHPLRPAWLTSLTLLWTALLALYWSHHHRLSEILRDVFDGGGGYSNLAQLRQTAACLRSIEQSHHQIQPWAHPDDVAWA
jgi:hypothetical protein